MNNIRITEYVDGIFKDVVMTEMAEQQKDAIVEDLTEQVKGRMAEGMTFDAAFDAVVSDVGDPNVWTAGFDKVPAEIPAQGTQAPEVSEEKERRGYQGNWQLAAVSPFVYFVLGMLFGWWAWAWVIIPVAGIVGAPISFFQKMTAVSPFVYVMLGMFFGWWSWAWVIIPIAGIFASRETR